MMWDVTRIQVILCLITRVSDTRQVFQFEYQGQ